MSYRTKKRRKQNLLASGILAGVAVMGSVVAYEVIEASSYNTPDDNGCFNDRITSTTALFVDSSVLTGNATRNTGRDVHNIFRNIFEQMNFNEKLILVSTEPGEITSVPKPRLTICRTAKTIDDLESVGADPNVTEAYLKQSSRKQYQKQLQPVIESLLSEKNAQTQESPILEYIQSISRMTEFSGDLTSRRLVLISDLIENRPPVHFCRVKNDLPLYRNFKQREHFPKIKPNRLDGVAIDIFMVAYDSYQPFCTESELRNFFTAYFEDAGANTPVFQRLLL